MFLVGVYLGLLGGTAYMSATEILAASFRPLGQYSVYRKLMGVLGLV